MKSQLQSKLPGEGEQRVSREASGQGRGQARGGVSPQPLSAPPRTQWEPRAQTAETAFPVFNPE